MKLKNPSVNESEALEFLNIISKDKIHKFRLSKYELKSLLRIPIVFLTSPILLLIVFICFIVMKAGFKYSLKSTFLTFISIIMSIRGRITTENVLK